MNLQLSDCWNVLIQQTLCKFIKFHWIIDEILEYEYNMSKE